jgi:hypothetical protein
MSISIVTQTAITVSEFTNSLGINTHIPYTDGEYVNIGLVASDLAYLGLNNVRDSISDGYAGSAPLSSYITLAKEGIHFTFIVEGVDDAAVATTLGLIAKLQTAVPGSVVAVEGPNEINNFSFTFDGVAGFAGAVAMQTVLYNDVQGNPALAGVAVDYFTGYGNTGGANGTDPVAAGIANFDNQHPYPNFGAPPAAAVNPAAALGNTSNPLEPAVYTETGYSTNTVNQTVQEDYTLDLLFDTSKDGIARTYLYQLLDAYAAGSPQGDDGYGLFDNSGAPKLAAVGLHNLTALMADPGGANFTPTTLNYSVSGLPADGNSELFEKSDGMFVLAVWAEPAIWDNATGTQIGAPAETVTVSIGGHGFSTAALFDPTIGTAAIASQGVGNSVTFSVTDHPLLIEIAPIACFAAGTRLLGVRGEIPVERLAVGDRLITHEGDEAPIIWIGRRRVDLCVEPQAQPVVVPAGALGAGVPEVDLVVSPDHALFFGGVLVPAKALVGAAGISRARLKAVTYYHVELPAHGIVFASGAAVESYLDTGNRGSFENCSASLPGQAKSCAPLVESGPVLARIRERLWRQFQFETRTIAVYEAV